VVKHVDAVKLRVVVAAVLAVAADAVLVAPHLLTLGAHLVSLLAHLHVHNLARRSSLEAGSTREERGGEERRNAGNFVWQFGTGNKKCRRHARVYPERKNKVILPLLFLECDDICFGHVPVTVYQGQRRDAVATGEEQLCSEVE
jgi:hypothetical protein